MLRFAVKRVLWMIPILFGILLIVFTISYFTPGDPVLNMLGSGYTQEKYDAMREDLGLDKPFLVRYGLYVKDIVTEFNFGTSYTTGFPVGEEMLGRMGVTLKMGVFSIIAALAVGIFLGIISAIRQRGLLDNSITSVSMLLAAMPNFWLGLMLMLLFSLKLGWLPATGITSWKHWILPTMTQCIGSIALLTRMTRSSVLEVIRQDYIRTARAKGIDERAVVVRHVLKNSLIPIVTIVGMQIGMIMGGSIIAESIFTIPGLGSYMMRGITSRDYPVINGCVLLMSTCICVMNLITDLAYGVVDPRIKAQYTTASNRRKLKKTLEKAEKREVAAV
ncbi:MAG: ABC transporter permease [Oscillospiraceae bacterium]|jgi:peptide/nickel transport system permease protein|nr:ABC transporter permease [Oscillospiraceae bacterium]